MKDSQYLSAMELINSISERNRTVAFELIFLGIVIGAAVVVATK